MNRSMPVISIRAKVFLLFSAAALITMVPVLVLIGRAVEDRVYERARDDLQVSYQRLVNLWVQQDEGLVETARDAANEPGIAALLQEGDTLALRRRLRQGLRLTTRLEILAVDSAGNTLLGPRLDTSAIMATGQGAQVTFTDGSEYPLRFAMLPVYGDSSEYAGRIGVGSPLDSAMIEGIRVEAGGELAVIGHDSLVATTLPDSLAGVLETLDITRLMTSTTFLRSEVERLSYLPRSLPFTAGDYLSGVILLRPVSQELTIVRNIRNYVVGVGATALLLSLGLAFVVARIVARPAQTLASAASELARGNYDAPLPAASGDEVGQLTRAFGEMRSAIAEREARLRSAQAELIHREKLAAMGRLVAQLSHEINNPIYNIQNCLEVLDRRGNPSDPNREFLSLAREELERMAILTRQLLDQSRPLSDAACPVDLNQIANRVVTLARGDATSRGVRVILDLEPTLPPVVAHPDAMQQVMANLVRNAIDAMPGGGVLRIETRSDDSTVEASFEDTGPGIEDEHLPHIFEAFYTTKPGIRGVGLGLFVSEGIVRGHAGQLRVESRPGEGARFIVRLPRETMGLNTVAVAKPDVDRPVTANA